MCNIQKREVVWHTAFSKNWSVYYWRMVTFELTCSHLMPNAAYLSNPAGMLSKNSRLSSMANKYKRDAWALVLWPIFRKMP